MFEGYTLGVIHQLVHYLLVPVLIALGLALAAVVWELGSMVSERLGSTKALLEQSENKYTAYVLKKIDRLDILARSGPILGLMGTLIPLGPGLTAMSTGDLSQLSTAISIAFDTTVVGLLVGLLAYILGKSRRRHFESVYDDWAAHHA